MAIANSSTARIIPFPKPKKLVEKKRRKAGLNVNKEGSIRKISGKVYVDFIYMDERVRESSGLVWSDRNARRVREQLDKIVVAIKSGTFKFAEVFPDSKKAEHFSLREREAAGLKAPPKDVVFENYALKWFTLRKDSRRVAGRTLLEYKSYLDNYLIPFFGEKTFEQLNAVVFEQFVSWARNRKLKGKCVSNASINKYFIPLKMICKQAAIEYQWGAAYNPFFGFKRLTEEDPKKKIFPFSIEEQKGLRKELPRHWKPYFDFAFRAGLRPGEQMALKPEDIEWSKSLLHVCRAITLDGNGNRIEGRTKNKFSRRTIKLTRAMIESLEAQKKLHDELACEYFFCTPSGRPVNLSNLRRQVWIPALERAGLKIREIKQTRHTFATVALSHGENPLWIAKVMGHRDTDMIVKVYSKYVENITGTKDGSILDRLFLGMKEKKSRKRKTDFGKIMAKTGKNQQKRGQPNC